MAVKINNKEVEGIAGVLLAIPILVFGYMILAIIYLSVALLLLSPLIIAVLLIAWLV